MMVAGVTSCSWGESSLMETDVVANETLKQQSAYRTYQRHRALAIRKFKGRIEKHETSAAEDRRGKD